MVLVAKELNFPKQFKFPKRSLMFNKVFWMLIKLLLILDIN